MIDLNGSEIEDLDLRTQKKVCKTDLDFWVEDRIRTGDPRYHKPML